MEAPSLTIRAWPRHQDIFTKDDSINEQDQGNQCQTPGVNLKNKLEETGKTG